MTGNYEGPERRRRGFNQTDFNRRREDEFYHDDIHLTVPQHLAEAHRSNRAEEEK
jgi:hypothetical protein